MTVFEKIKKLFDSARIKYKVIEHPPVFTSAEAALIRDTDVSMGAKALVCFADKKPILVVLPGDKKADFKRFKKNFNIKDLRMATPAEVSDITSLRIGSIPPVGSVLRLASYFDDTLCAKDTVAFNAGSHTISIVMSASDLISIEKPTLTSLICL